MEEKAILHFYKTTYKYRTRLYDDSEKGMLNRKMCRVNLNCRSRSHDRSLYKNIKKTRMLKRRLAIPHGGEKELVKCSSFGNGW
jgi:hypothetical protein